MTMRLWVHFLGYWSLSLAFLGLVPLAQWIFAVPSLDFANLARVASEANGVAWTSNLFDVVRLASVEPGLWLLLLGSAAPTIAAITMMLVIGERDEFRRWCTRFNPIYLWRQANLRSAGAVMLACAATIAALLLTFEIRGAIGLEYERSLSVVSSAVVPALLAGMFLDQGAVLEEGGWRGFAGPLLQHGGVQPLYAALLIGVAWGLWHLPRDMVGGVIERLGVDVYATLYLPAFLAGTISVSVVAAYCVNQLGGSVLPAIVIHGLTNDAVGVSGAATIETALTPLHQITKAAPLLVLAAGIVLVAGPQLGARRSVGSDGQDGARVR